MLLPDGERKTPDAQAPFRSGAKVQCTGRIGKSQQEMGKEQLVLLGNQHLSGGTYRLQWKWHWAAFKQNPVKDFGNIVGKEPGK